MERETGRVKKSDLMDRLTREYDIQRSEAERLFRQLTREGTLYEPPGGYIGRAQT
jgi:hypothetical protein